MKPPFRRRLPIQILLVYALLGGLVAIPARANASEPSSPAVIFNVNDTDDAPDFNVGDGKCDAGPLSPGDQCTLRAAIQEANLKPGAVLIIVPSGVYTVNAETVTLNGGAGTCTITAHQSGNAEYFAAADVQRGFSVLPPAGQADYSTLLPMLRR
jgi:hypothetical protein